MNPAEQIPPRVAALDQIAVHSHACTLHGSMREQYAVVVPFLRIGIERGEKCLYVADDGRESVVREAMQAEGIDVERAVATKALAFATREEVYLHRGSFDAAAALTFWRSAVKRALEEGFAALRASAELDWIVRSAQGPKRWAEYESALTLELMKHRCVFLCQYDRRLFPPELVLDVIRTHPKVIVRGTVGRNLFHVPPAEFLASDRSARAVERQLLCIQEREQVEQALLQQRDELRDSEQLCRLMLDGVQDYALYSLDADGRVTSWNAGAEGIKGYRVEEILGQHAARFYTPEEAAEGKPDELLRRAARAGRVEQEGWRVRRNGTRFWASVLVTALRDETGRLVGYSNLTRDVTARKKAEEEQGRSAALPVEGQGASHTGSWAFDLRSRNLYWSDEHFRIFGLEPGAAKPTCELVFGMIHPQDRAFVKDRWDGAMRGRSDYDCEFRVVLADGRVKRMHSLAHPVLGEFGEPTEYVGLTMDVTERRQAEEALRTAHVELARVSRVVSMGELTASIAHEVNQPLAAVIANANASLRWLAGSRPNIDEARDALRRIIRDGNRASEVITGIRALVRKAGAEKRSLDINDVVRAVIVLATGELHRNGVLLRTQFAGDLPHVLGDRVQLQQVMLNLITNAVEAMSSVAIRPPELLISTNRDAVDRVRVSVRDSGTGVEKANLERAFDPFYTTKPEGLGIGLSISRSIIEAHHGALWATQNEGPGATFHFTLPIQEPDVP